MGRFDNLGEEQSVELWDRLVEDSIMKFRGKMESLPSYEVYKFAPKIMIYEKLYQRLSSLDYGIGDFENTTKNLEYGEDILDKIYNYFVNSSNELSEGVTSEYDILADNIIKEFEETQGEL